MRWRVAMWARLRLLPAARGKERRDVLEVLVATASALEADQVIESDRPNGDSLDLGLDSAQAHLLIATSTRDLGGVEEVKTADGGGKGEVGAPIKSVGVGRVDAKMLGIDASEGGAELCERCGQGAQVLRAPLDEDVDVAGVAKVAVEVDRNAADRQVLDAVALENREDPHRIGGSAIGIAVEILEH